MGGQTGLWALQCKGHRNPPPRGQVVLGSPGSWVGETDLTPKSLFLWSQIISQIWPYLSMIMENKFREKLEPKIREKSIHLKTFTFTKLYFGQKVGDKRWVMSQEGQPVSALQPFLCPRPCPRSLAPD